MKTTTYTCDRCHATITQGRNVLQVAAGDLIKKLAGELDLCDACGTAFRTFLHNPPAATEASATKSNYATRPAAKGDCVTTLDGKPAW